MTWWFGFVWSLCCFPSLPFPSLPFLGFSLNENEWNKRLVSDWDFGSGLLPLRSPSSLLKTFSACTLPVRPFMEAVVNPRGMFDGPGCKRVSIFGLSDPNITGSINFFFLSFGFLTVGSN